jgi:transcriptional regulator with XRE-family HTH domain
MPRPRRTAKPADHGSRFAPTPLPDRPVMPRGRMFASVLDLVGGTPHELSINVGRNLRGLRTRRGFSLERLAKASRVSRAMLGQIENGKSTPTIAFLWKVATALNVPFATLITARDTAGTVVLRKEREKLLSSSEGKFVSRPLFPFDAERNVEFYELRIATYHTAQAEAHASGTHENLIVNSGAVKIAVGQEPPVRFARGRRDLFRSRRRTFLSQRGTGRGGSLPGHDPCAASRVMHDRAERAVRRQQGALFARRTCGMRSNNWTGHFQAAQSS